MTNIPKKSRKRASPRSKTSGEIPCVVPCANIGPPPSERKGRDTEREGRDTFIEECLVLMPKVEAGLSAYRSSTMVHLESPPSSIIRVMANGATAHALADLACFATAFEAALLYGETEGWTESLTEVFDKSFAMLSLHLEVAKAGAAWNSDWDTDLVADLMVTASPLDQIVDKAVGNSPDQLGVSTDTESFSTHHGEATDGPTMGPFLHPSPQMSQVHYHKQATTLWDGRESLFLKLWGVLSRTTATWSSVKSGKPASVVKRPQKARRSRGEEDPLLEALR
ncbi:conserved hypothetical protein [Rhodospirillaceae bacterium LM-1]|nr:conserved hypothetical protein [Rhodospirillaceae bacterium LM-1]